MLVKRWSSVVPLDMKGVSVTLQMADTPIHIQGDAMLKQH